MAIGPDGKVTTTGLMDSKVKTPNAPDMSNLKPASQPKEKTAPAAAMVKKPEVKDPDVIEKLNSLTNEEKQQLDMVLSPSLSSILTKILPEASGVISQFTSTEENVILPVSVVKNFAKKKYPSDTEQGSIEGFVTELSESQSDNTNVPPENIQASNGMMAQKPDTASTDAIDQDLV